MSDALREFPYLGEKLHTCGGMIGTRSEQVTAGVANKFETTVSFGDDVVEGRGARPMPRLISVISVLRE